MMSDMIIAEGYIKHNYPWGLDRDNWQKGVPRLMRVLIITENDLAQGGSQIVFTKKDIKMISYRIA